MTPLHIEIMLHYNASPDDYREGDFSAPAVREALDLFLSEYLIEHGGRRPSTNYQITDRGLAYVRFLCEMPLPVNSWVMPK